MVERELHHDRVEAWVQAEPTDRELEEAERERLVYDYPVPAGDDRA